MTTLLKKDITRNALELRYLIYLKSRMRPVLVYNIGKVRSKNTLLTIHRSHNEALFSVSRQ